MNEFVKILIQFLAAFILMIVIHVTVISRLYPSLQDFKPNPYATPEKNVVDIVKGAVPLNMNNIVVNTRNPLKDYFIQLPRPTYYKQGGFAYSFWLNTESTSNESLYGKILLLRGVNKRVHIYDLAKSQTNLQNTERILVKMPLIRFMTEAEVIHRMGTTADESSNRSPYFVVEYNTTTNPNEKWVVNSKIQRILRGNKFFMITFVFHDYINEYKIKDGYRIDMYIDNRLVASKVAEDTGLLTNHGPIYILPNQRVFTEGDTDDDARAFGTIASRTFHGFITDIRYFDFAPNIQEIDGIFQNGYSKDNYITPKSQKIQTVQDNYNLISLKNEMSQL